MTITISIEGKAYPAKPPYETATFADVGGGWKCRCGSSRTSGRGMHHDHDTYRSTGHCTDCGVELGPIVAKVSTIFGIEEDERVLHGRARVY